MTATPDPRRVTTFRPGWLQGQVAKSVASLDSLPPKLRASLAQPTTRRRHHMTTINDETVRAAIDAAFPGLPAGMTLDEAERRMRAGLAAVVPLIRAQVAAEHRCVTVVEEDPPEFFIDDHDMAAIGMFEPDEPVADVVAAFEGGEKGVTKRPVSATAIRGALYDSLSPNFEIDSDGYDDAAVAVALLVEGKERCEGDDRG